MEEEKRLMQCVKKGENGYPERLSRLPGMPEQLYYYGRLPDDDKPTAAIVGARSCSTYGRLQAFRYARFLSNAGVQVISGLASGIDSEGHKGALNGRENTFAVMGCGPDICYPEYNKGLYKRILESGGGILSEYPPGTWPRSYFFPARNRIISGLSDVVIIVEAREKSGSLITAGEALEQGKSVYAVPGPVTDELSRGCHRLIYDGAGIAYDPAVLLMEWGIFADSDGNSEQNAKISLATDYQIVYDCLDSRPKSLDYLIRKTGLPPEKLSLYLVEMSFRGLCMEVSRNYYIRL